MASKSRLTSGDEENVFSILRLHEKQAEKTIALVSMNLLLANIGITKVIISSPIVKYKSHSKSSYALAYSEKPLFLFKKNKISFIKVFLSKKNKAAIR